ncbi:MAG: DUF1501 domain-containing protein [Caulobacteraceae bacterium]
MNPSSLTLSRRSLLSLGAGFGLTYLTAPALAATTGAKRKLVVIVCRGAMDGLSVSPPIGDRNYAGLRGAIAISADQALKLDADFGLHPKLATIYGLAQTGQARIVPAAAIPQRIRSHFEAQDLLESGGEQLYGATTGWLNRALSALTPDRRVTAISIGAQEPLVLRGPTAVQSWSPGGHEVGDLSRVKATLADLYQADPVLGPALASGLETEARARTMTSDQAQARDVRGFAITAGKFLSSDGGPSVAVLSLDGFDTHANQGAANGLLAARLTSLDDAVAGLKEGLGPSWSQTVVLAVTEFGRTAHVNGTGGTDHGTASTMILAGGALKPGGLIGDWPTLAPAKLFENRDLAPTLDVRQVFKTALMDHLGVDRRSLDTIVFPDSAIAPPISNLV